MKIRTLTAGTMQEAMAKVREELGPDAVILHVEESKSKKGVVIRAAADDPETAPLDTDNEAAFAPIETRLEQELRARLRVFRPVIRSSVQINPEQVIAPCLAFHRTPQDIAARLCTLAAESGAGSDRDALAHALERTIASGPLPACPSRPVIVLGAPGHGKSTVLARLAVQAAQAGAKAVLLTLDTGKAGAVAQIETYGALIKARTELVENAERLKTLVQANRDQGVVLIDTPGLNLWDDDALIEARAWIAASGAEPVWVTSAEGGVDDLCENAVAVAQLGVRRAIITKMDIARRFGSALAGAAAGRIALSYFVSSAFLADGLEPATPGALADRILKAAANAPGAQHVPMEEALSA
jgi:flagellar biosynthesis protein FlhF